MPSFFLSPRSQTLRIRRNQKGSDARDFSTSVRVTAYHEIQPGLATISSIPTTW